MTSTSKGGFVVLEIDILEKIEEIHSKGLEPKKISLNEDAFDEICFSRFREKNRIPEKMFGLKIVIVENRIQRESFIVY